MLICFGSPMLDIIANVDECYLKKYDLTADSAIRVGENNQEIFREILEMEPIILPGGSVTNTVRVFQWVCKSPNRITFVGTIGQDEPGRIIKKRLDSEKINYHFVEIATNTGRCAVLVTPEGSRSLVADLGASKLFTLKDMDEFMWQSINKANHLYISTFFLSVSTEVTRIVVEHFVENQKKIIVNLGSCLLCEKYPVEVEHLVKNADVVVGNNKEFSTFATGCRTTSKNIKQVLLEINKKHPNKPERILIATAGPEPVVVLENGVILCFQVKKIKEEHIVDTNGAGDAFVGGFLAKFIEGENLETCIKCGSWCSRVIVENHGCSFDNKEVYDD